MNSVKEKVCILIFLISFFAGKLSTYAQTDTTLQFTEGDYAVIYVKNESFHNHISVLWLCHH